MHVERGKAFVAMATIWLGCLTFFFGNFGSGFAVGITVGFTPLVSV